MTIQVKNTEQNFPGARILILLFYGVKRGINRSSGSQLLTKNIEVAGNFHSIVVEFLF